MIRRLWISRLLSRKTVRPHVKPDRRARLALETLEGRLVPATLLVNSLSDTGVDGQTTLRQAIAQANANSEANTILFDANVFSAHQTIALTDGQLELTNSAAPQTITGPAAGLTIGGGGTSRVFQVDAGTVAELTELTIVDGSADSGSGVSNSGTLTMTTCTVTGNSASGNGAGIYNAGTLTLDHSIVSDNNAGGNGGGIHNATAAVLELTDCTISGNTSGFFGGGLYNYSGASATLSNCTINGNYGIYGGGITSAGDLTLLQCTISGNSAAGVGAVYMTYYSTATIINCTISGNMAPQEGGILGGPGVSLANTIIAGNSADFSPDVSGTFQSLGHNLIGDASGATGWVDTDLTGSSAAPLDPVLAPLGSYGGSTQTMAVLPGSPAFGAGDASLIPAGFATDQRGDPRLRDGSVDIGAFESHGFTVSIVPGSTPQSADIGTAFAQPLAVRVAANDPGEPVDGGVVRFVAHPAANGASAILLASSAVIDASQANMIAAPNNVDGAYQISAEVSGLTGLFDLTNTGASFASLTVNTTTDALAPGPGLLSLREAIGFANADVTGSATISFDPAVFGSAQTITLALGQLELDNPNEAVSIVGPAAGLAISADGASRVFQIDSGTVASLSGLTIDDGNATLGGGVLNSGTLTLTDCTVSGNTANSNGGGLFNQGDLTLSHTTFSGNNSGAYGGGLCSYGTLSIADSSLSNNSAAEHGGAIFSGSYSTATLVDCVIGGNTAQSGAGLVVGFGSTVDLTNCTISGNAAVGLAGGVYNQGALTMTDCDVSGNTGYRACGIFNSSSGSATLTDCTIADNVSPAKNGRFGSNSGGGGIRNAGHLVMMDCSITGNAAVFGGGLYIISGTADLTNCTISGNKANGGGGGLFVFHGSATLTNCTISGNTIISGGAFDGGGGIYNGSTSTVTLTNCTITGNFAIGAGGALENESSSTATLINCTISGNSADDGGGVSNDAKSTINIGNTIVAVNTANGSGNDTLGTFASQGNNLVGQTDGSDGWITSDLTGTGADPLNPLLAPPGEYGGTSQTMALLPGSPAIDAGAIALIPGGVTTDQRGLARIVNGSVDIGAQESSGFTIAVTSGSGQSAINATVFAAPLVVTVTAVNSVEPVAGGTASFATPPTGASADLSSELATIAAAGTASVDVTANNTGGAYAIAASTSGATNSANFSLTNIWESAFSGLTSTSIIYGTSTTTLTGHLGSGSAFPSGSSVSITLDSMVRTATIDDAGNFAVSFSTATLGVASSPYTVAYDFAGIPTFTAATDIDTTLTVVKANANVVVTPYSVTYDGAVHTATIASISGVNGESGPIVGAVSLNSTHTNAGTYANDSWSFAGSANYNDIAATTLTDVIGRAPLTITANDDSKAFGTLKAFSKTAFTETGLIAATTDKIAEVTETSTGTIEAAAVGSYGIVPNDVTGSGLDNYDTTFVNGALVVGKAATMVAVSSSSNPSLVGKTITFTATISASTGTFDNGGTIQFVVDNANLGSPVVVQNGQAAVTTSVLADGPHSVSALYSGDDSFAAGVDALSGGQTVQLASGQISGKVSRDFNLNRQHDSNEPGLAGQTVFLDANKNGVFDAGEPSAVSGVDGTYSFQFAGLTPGSFSVREVQLGGVLLSAPVSQSYTVDAGSQANFTNLDFLNVLTSIAVPLTLPPATSFPTHGHVNADYVEAVYRAVLERAAEPSGLGFWSGLLDSGSLSRLEVAQGIRNSPEHLEQEVNALYTTLLGRAADVDGLAGWVGQLEHGLPEEQIAAAFLISPEFVGKGDKFFIDAMSKSLLGRAIDSTGEAFWLAQLGDDASGNPAHTPTLSHAQVIADFLYSEESLERLVDGCYEVFLRRRSDQDGLSFWVDHLQKGFPFQTIGQQFLGSDEFFSKATANG